MSELILLNGRNEGDKVIFTHGQETKHILEENARRRKNSDEEWANSDPDMKQAASIPMVVWLLWESAGITKDKKQLLKAIERNKEYKVTEKRLI